MTVLGVTRMRGRFHPDQNLCNHSFSKCRTF
jgi:hypothetical protein